jgi:hypothetical protein
MQLLEIEIKDGLLLVIVMNFLLKIKPTLINSIILI